MDPDDGNVDHSFIVGYDVFAIIIVLYALLVMLTAALSRQVQRRASWFNFMLPVMFYAASFLLSIDLQGLPNSKGVPRVSCVMQAVLIYALPVYCTIGFGCLVLDLYLLLKRLLEHEPESRIMSIIVLVIPPGSFLSILITDLVLFLVDPGVGGSLELDPSRIYCHSHPNAPMTTYITVCVGIPGFLLWFIVYFKIVLLLKKNKPVIMQYDKPTRKNLLSVFIRTSLMTLVITISALLAIYVIVGPSLGPSVVVAWLIFPLLSLLMFGTQPDFFRCWMCRRRSKMEPPPEPDRTGLSSL